MSDTTSLETLKARESNAAVYKKSLTGQTNTIRLLRVSRKGTDTISSDVTWTLEDYKLDSVPPCRYTALSYFWGRGELRKSIVLHGIRFKVLDSVFPVLEAIRTNVEFSSTDDSWWWIDSICINQNDYAERGSQVGLMGEIYRKSHRTVGWFGEGSGGGDEEDPDFTTRGESAIESLIVLRKQRNKIAKVKGKHRKAAMKLVDTHVVWSDVEELMLRPWWRRVWTLQEYLIAPKFEFWCGKRHIDKKTLKSAIFSIYNLLKESEYKHAISSKAWFPVWNRRRLSMWHRLKRENLPLVALVAYGSDCKATDPKDRIYSVLDLAKGEFDEELVRRPLRYDKVYTAGDAYFDFVKTFVEKHKSLDIICCVHVFNQKGKSSEKVPKLPSWVPDWTAEVPSYVVPVMASQSNNPRIGNFRPVDEMNNFDECKAFAASGDLKPEHKFLDDRKTLNCVGIILDTISDNGDTKISKPGQEAVLTPDEASSILDKLASTLVLGRTDRYLTTPYTPGHYYHDLRAFCIACTKHPEHVPAPFFHWYRQAKDLLLHGHKLADIRDLSLKKPRFAESYNHFEVNAGNRFFSRFLDTTRAEAMDRILVTTEGGRFGMGPRRAQQGDKIVVLKGCSIPLVLGPTGEEYEVIGECYLGGFMDGEAIEMVQGGVFGFEKIVLV